MAPAAITEDYYMILEVEQNATLQLIVKSYRRLALKLHPDRNRKPDATVDFQRLGRAYETLKDESKRREYDVIYPSLRQRRPSPRDAQTPCPPPASTSQAEALSEAAQIAAIQHTKQERSARWRTITNAYNLSILELQEGIQRLEQEIKNLDSIFAAEAATEARRNSWGTWLLSPIYKEAEYSEDEKARKDRESQERRIEKDMKARRLEWTKADLKKEENRFREAKKGIEAADLRDDERLQIIEAKIWARENRARQERERLEQERMAKLWTKQREAAEAMRKQQAERRATQQKQHDDIRKSQNTKGWEQHSRICRHEGWWPKIQGHTTCPNCYEGWTFLLQCPGCKMKACPRCQAAIRPRMVHNAARTNRRVPPRARTPSPDLGYDDCY